MSRTRRGSKPLGYDYWSKRPCSKSGYGRIVKDMTNSRERMQEQKLLAEELQNYKGSKIEQID